MSEKSDSEGRLVDSLRDSLKGHKDGILTVRIIKGRQYQLLVNGQYVPRVHLNAWLRRGWVEYGETETDGGARVYQVTDDGLEAVRKKTRPE